MLEISSVTAFHEVMSVVLYFVTAFREVMSVALYSVTEFHEVISVGLYSVTPFHEVIFVGRNFSVTAFHVVISVGCNGAVCAFLTVISIGRNSYKPICEVSQLGRTSVNSSQFRWAVLQLLQCVLANPCDNCERGNNMTPPLFVDRGGRIHKDFSKLIVMTISIFNVVAYYVPKRAGSSYSV